ncbi:hypothetical protein L6164_018187 [Bauhinia variegata]|uniref:Uncharacterized protein n=1 Tax=Bauhinia variegata TaxID=167791 RepID=A0ACB9NBF2_BAUVA|nr:hypothetical protein L6164_018187 [Bauhinia variegata]
MTCWDHNTQGDLGTLLQGALYPPTQLGLKQQMREDRGERRENRTIDCRRRSTDYGCGPRCSEHNKEQGQMDASGSNESVNSMPSSQEQEEVIKKKYGGMLPKKTPLISKDHERAYFDSADWALGKQGVEKPKGPLEALRPKLQPTQQQTRYRKSPYAPSGEEGGSVPTENAPSNE